MKKLILIAALSSFTAHAGSLRVQTHTASDAGFAVNSHLITGQRDAILVDAQFTRSEARQVSEMIRRSGKHLTTIFITHGHPDHYFGLEVLSHDFPKARIVATRNVIADIRATAAEKLAYWKTIYKDDLTDKVIVPEELQASALDLEGESLPVEELGPGESEHAAVVYLPALKTLVAGDLAFHGVHLWLAENHPESWLTNLRDVRELGEIVDLLPGHGLPGTAAILDEDRHYIESFLEVTAPPTTQVAALSRLKALYPGYRLPIIAELSVQARVK
jgi:glyoxylase-like metal-dependent hydrolase (beta-lactamase superfamily II)